MLAVTNHILLGVLVLNVGKGFPEEILEIHEMIVKMIIVSKMTVINKIQGYNLAKKVAIEINTHSDG